MSTFGIVLDWSSTLLLPKNIYIIGSRANSSQESVIIKYIKYYFSYKICL